MQKFGGDVGGLADKFTKDPANKGLLGNATGGVVTGISGGIANISPAPGEGLASIGRGERIVPNGGGGGGPNISIQVDGIGGADLANFIKGKVNEGIYEYKRREKYN